MSTQLPPTSKKQKREAQLPKPDLNKRPEETGETLNVRLRLVSSETGAELKGLRVPSTTTPQQLELLVNELLNNSEKTPYEFVLSGESEKPIINDIHTDIITPQIKTTEDELQIIYTPRAVFRVRNITRSSGVALGHGATILTAQFAPHTATSAATGAGDCTARLWNTDSGTPTKVLETHADHVLSVKYSPDGKMLATASKNGLVSVFSTKDGSMVGKRLTGHAKYVTDLCWEPLHLVPSSRAPYLASSSADGTARIWDVENGLCVYTLSGHTNSVSCVRWSGFNYIYTGSHDKSIKVWKDGRMVSNLKAHAHWVNHMALSTEFHLKSGPFGPTMTLDLPIPSADASPEELRSIAKQKFEKISANGEIMVSASDDFTMFLWDPIKHTKPLARLTGHQKLVNHVAFSPDGKFLASASFDNSVKLWDGKSGKFLASFRGHVAPVYQCAWSADSRLLCSGSKDTTVKIWDVATKKLKSDLPGHLDEVFAVDWSVDGTKVISGGRDKTVRFWTH